VNAAFAAAATEGRSPACSSTPRTRSSRRTSWHAASCTFDSGLTMVQGIDEHTSLVKILGWYDNEWATRTAWSTWSRSSVALVSDGVPEALASLPVLETWRRRGRRVLVRCDFNTPLEEDEHGVTRVADDFRIRPPCPPSSGSSP